MENEQQPSIINNADIPQIMYQLGQSFLNQQFDEYPLASECGDRSQRQSDFLQKIQQECQQMKYFGEQDAYANLSSNISADVVIGDKTDSVLTIITQGSTNFPQNHSLSDSKGNNINLRTTLKPIHTQLRKTLFQLDQVTYEWREFLLSFKSKKDSKSYPLLICAIADELKILNKLQNSFNKNIEKKFQNLKQGWSQEKIKAGLSIIDRITKAIENDNFGVRNREYWDQTTHRQRNSTVLDNLKEMQIIRQEIIRKGQQIIRKGPIQQYSAKKKLTKRK